LYSAIAPSSATPLLSDCSNTGRTSGHSHTLCRESLAGAVCFIHWGALSSLTSPILYVSIDQYSIFSDVSKQNMGSLSMRHRSAGRLSPLRRSCSRPGSSRSLHANSCRPEEGFKWQLCTTQQARACYDRLCHAQTRSRKLSTRQSAFPAEACNHVCRKQAGCRGGDAIRTRHALAAKPSSHSRQTSGCLALPGMRR
jgi:hypothetical protein